MSFNDPELLNEFVVESLEHLADVENQLLSLEGNENGVDVPMVNKVFRAVHSIKGAAGFLGLTTLESLAHRGEEVLDGLRNNSIRPTNEVVNALLRATDRLKALLASIDTSNEQDVSDDIQQLQGLLVAAANAAESSNSSKVSDKSSSFEAKVEDSSQDLRLATDVLSGPMGDAYREFLIESQDSLSQIESDMVLLEKEPDNGSVINNLFRNIHTIKGAAGFLALHQIEKTAHAGESLLDAVRNREFGFDSQICTQLLTMVDTLKQCLAAVERAGSDSTIACEAQVDQITQLLDDRLNGVQKLPTETSMDATLTSAPRGRELPKTREKQVTEPTGGSEPHPQPTPSNASVKSDSSGHSQLDSSIRVDVSLLDKLMTRVGELVLARNQIIQFTNQFGNSDLQRTTQRLNLITTELQDDVMKTRMQQIGNVWTKFPRMVRDLAAICGKEVRIEMVGKETELDKTIIESIKDPLTHLVRNTVDHGIEKPSVRRENGKPAEGCLTLRAFHEGGQVNIEISDDGAGLNLDRIKQKAVEKNLVSPEAAARLTEREIAQLIFLPGFSTAETVSNVSGRGVGMDVVKTNIEKIGGTVDLQTVRGVGTTIKIKIPLTLAIIPALLVTSDGNRFAIPQVNLLELVRLEGENATDSIEWIHGSPVYRLRGNLLPLVYLKKTLKTKPVSEQSDCINIVVLKADDRQFGLVVDRINDTEEIVVKPLSSQLKGVTVYSGATIMGDGKVALILDVLGIAYAENLISKDRNRSTCDNSRTLKERGSGSQNLLLVATETNRRLAIPISQVARLEKIATDQIEHAENQEVVQYRGNILPLIRLADMLGLSDDTPLVDGQLNVIVYTQNFQSYGLVVNRIVDIVETSTELERKGSREGLLGSAIIQEHVTDFVNLPAIIAQLDANRFQFSSSTN